MAIISSLEDPGPDTDAPLRKDQSRISERQWQ